ncbi:cupin domain-containing protein [Pyxidicoccus xibeiensis]|uniref:cupin domain-containing protein n=1 Tax=Pyxidicoccus xibeiensis TaxID=2906759 RepID=UPI0020A7E172|nr:cupin domain-containing protein [Pyxidicoccus xibeiensis]MCP3136278.1 cupin domain-containing protein [Pyxidicoccus xibeiensis]
MQPTYHLTPTESVTVHQHSPEALVVEVEYGSRASPPPPHFHPSQDERFEVLSGTLHTVVDGKARTLQTGDTLDIPRGAVHRLWNASDDTPARVIWRTLPAGRTLEWFAALDAARRDGPRGKDGLPSPLALAVLLRTHRDTIRLSQRPRFLVGAGLAVLATLGRLRGYRVEAGSTSIASY